MPMRKIARVAIDGVGGRISIDFKYWFQDL